MSHEMIAMPASDTVYTFSFTTDWFHTVNAVAPINVAMLAPTIRRHRSGNHPTSTRSVVRNHIAAATALHAAAKMLMRMATEPAMGNRDITRPSSTNSGFPGGCGSPRVYAAARYSLVSHIAVLGARVTR